VPEKEQLEGRGTLFGYVIIPSVPKRCIVTGLFALSQYHYPAR
jgi:hypothetical protein